MNETFDMNVVDLKAYKAAKDNTHIELIMLNGELKNLLKLRDSLDFNISIIQEMINTSEDKLCQKQNE